MNQNLDWMFNEFKSVGVNYFDKNIVSTYDEQHEKFRNFNEEAQKIVTVLNLTKNSIILDIGCGTAGLTTNLAGLCKHVHAVDASDEMVNILNNKIEHQKLTNITTSQAGFISYDHPKDSLDAIIANICIHHLPDFWKQIALCKFYTFLKPGGRLFLTDVVFSFKPNEYEKKIDDWIINMNSLAGDQMAKETIVHVREEFSTWDWIMIGMLKEAGFSINSNIEIMENIRNYICTKTPNEKV